MKKLTFNSPHRHKPEPFRIDLVIIEKVVELPPNAFHQLKNFPMKDNQNIAKYKDLMYWGTDGIHAVLFLNAGDRDGIWVESEGHDYARKAGYLPNARGIILANEMTVAERELHNKIKEYAEKIIPLVHNGEKSIALGNVMTDGEEDDLLEKIMKAISETVMQYDGIKSSEFQNCGVLYQEAFRVETEEDNNMTTEVEDVESLDFSGLS